MIDPVPYAGPIGVTLAYIGLYYMFQVNVLRVKTRLERALQARGQKFDRYFGQDREMLAADRVQLNMLEHMPPFLLLLWLNALFVGPGSTTIAGAVYVAARAAYPFVMGARLGRGIRPAVLLSTAPGYLVLGWFCGALVWKLLV